MMQKISVAICTYNGARFLAEQIDSILNQTMPVHEIVVCDDGSTDATVALLQDYDQKNPGLFRLYQNEVNLRSVKNFEKAIGLCTGDVIFLSDQDDHWAVDKVEHYMRYFETHPEIEVLTSNGYCINDQSELLEKHTIWDAPQFLKERNIAFDYFKLITYISNIATGASMAIRKKILPEIMPFPVIKDFHHDEWIAIVASRKNAFEMLEGKYLYYRVHEQQQVGGISFDKTDFIKDHITNTFDFMNPNVGFTIFKRRLRNLSNSYKKNKYLYENTLNYKRYFSENLSNIETLFANTRQLMRKKYYFMSAVLNISDKMLNKRQLKK